MRQIGFKIKTYLHYRRNSVNQYGLHSPFLFELYQTCFKPKFKHPFPVISQIRKKLSKDESKVRITDLGAGSQVSDSNIRTVKDMHASASLSKKQGELFFRLITHLGLKKGLELGTHLGCSAMYLCQSDNLELTTVEGCPETAKIAQNTFKECGVNPEVIVGSFDEVLPSLLEKKEFDFVYIDGNHTVDSTLKYFSLIEPKMTRSGIIIFDDINWSKGMNLAWNEVITHPKITISINCYKFGIVMFNPAFSKEDFYFKF